MTTATHLRGAVSASSSGDDTLVSSISSSWMATNTDFTASANDVTELADVWNQVVAPLWASTTKSNDWWKQLVELHSEPQRAYHTLVHLKECLGFLKLVNKSNNPAMVLSVLFHDAIYDPKSGSNEEDSAKLFQEFCREVNLEDDALVDTVVRYILATKSHQHDQDDDDELALFLDIDMAVLGKQETAYLEYAGLIRQEYNFVERNMYCEKRAEILEKFLESKIFVSTVMNQALEKRARSNLQKEIELLKAGVIPGDSKS